jgi:drug/metabolite transporter (DMT)-like permease
MCYGSVMGFMFALAELPEVQVAIAQPLVPALALGFSAMLGIELLSVTAVSGIVVSIAGAVAFTFLNSSGGEGATSTPWFGYGALVFELISYAGQLVYLPRMSHKYGPVTLTAMYYMVATAATSATLVVREHDHLDQVCPTMPWQSSFGHFLGECLWASKHLP